MAKNQATVGRKAAHQRQLLRRSNATVPIPSIRHKRSRSYQKQDLRQQYR